MPRGPFESRGSGPTGGRSFSPRRGAAGRALRRSSRAPGLAPGSSARAGRNCGRRARGPASPRPIRCSASAACAGCSRRSGWPPFRHRAVTWVTPDRAPGPGDRPAGERGSGPARRRRLHAAERGQRGIHVDQPDRRAGPPPRWATPGAATISGTRAVSSNRLIFCQRPCSPR